MLPFFVDEVPADLGLDAAAWDHDTLRTLLRCPELAGVQESQPGAAHEFDIV